MNTLPTTKAPNLTEIQPAANPPSPTKILPDAESQIPPVVLHVPECPKDLVFLKKETARVHAGAVFWYLENSGFSAGEQLAILEELWKRISD